MGAGIAPQIAKAFPEAEEADNETARGDVEKLGTFSYADITQNDGETLTVHNLYTQFGTGGRAKGVPDVDYEALRSAFKLLNAEVKNLSEGRDGGWYEFVGVEQLCGIPMIGAGLAGGDWEIISKIINEVTPDMKIELVVYKP
jgi:O-acetyl-ADP-ribose deacetylase (regulator of RNase III)